MAKLTDLDIVGLAVQGRVYSAGLKLRVSEAVKLSEDKTVRERARKIVLRQVIGLIRGKDVEPRMQYLIAAWCYQQLAARKPGRPNTEKKGQGYLCSV